MSLNREQFVNSVKTVSVSVPDLGEVLIRPLSIKDRAEIIGKYIAISSMPVEDAAGRADAMVQAQLFMIAKSLVDESGTRMFDASSADDTALLADKTDAVLGVIADAATVLNGFAAGAVEEEAKK